MRRIPFVVAFVVISSSVAVAQTGGGGDTGGDTGGGTVGGDTGSTIGGETTESTEIDGRGLETGRTEESRDIFAGPEDGEGTFDTEGGQTSIRRSFGTVGNEQITTGGSTSQQRAIRPQFRLGFVPSQALISRNRRRAISSFNSITPRVKTLRNVSITPDQSGTVTLRGQAESRYDFLLAAAIARLQPGVRSIRNEITINPRPAAVPLQPQIVPDAPVEPLPPTVTLPEPPATPVDPN